jgi:phytoene dehydrogenase-like protein
MTTQPMQPVPQQLPPVDPGNPLLSPTPTTINAAQVDTPIGKRLAFTVRTPSTTLTIFLEREFAADLARQLAAEAASMGGLVVPAGTGLIR